MTWVDISKIARNSHLGEFGDGAGHLDTGRTGANDNESEQAPPLRFVLGYFRPFEGRENAGPQPRRIVDLLEARRKGFPVVMAEIGVPRTGSDNEIVIRNFAFAGDDEAALKIDIEHPIHEHGRILLFGEDAPDRRGDLRRREPGGCHLVEQGLEQVIIVPVDHRHVDGCRFERLRSIEAAKAGAQKSRRAAATPWQAMCRIWQNRMAPCRA